MDEFQDTNAIQYAWLRLLAGTTGVPFVVGDDDQSIYRWRGAKQEHLRRYQRDFPGSHTVHPDQHSLSPQTILSAANAVIANNTGRLGKELWTAGSEGAPIRLYRAYNERDEAEFVVGRIRTGCARATREMKWLCFTGPMRSPGSLKKCCCGPACSYRVYGGQRFFERAEIKDALAYMRLLANRDDDPSFERVVNVPTRGIGARSIDAIREYGKANALSLWRSAQVIAAGDGGSRGAKAIQVFLHLIETLARDTAGLALHEQVDYVIQRSGLIEHYRKEPRDRAEARLENLDELVSAARSFDPEATGNPCRHWSPSWPMPRSRPARPRPRRGRTACS